MFGDREAMGQAMMRAAQQAIRDHRAAGVPLVSSKDGKPVLVDPETPQELSEEEAEKWLKGTSIGGRGPSQ